MEGGSKTVRATKQVRNTRKVFNDVPEGFGIFISPQNGDTFINGAPIHINQPGHAAESTQVSYAQQSTQPTQTSRVQTSTSPHNTRSKNTLPAQETRSKKTLGIRRKVFKK